MLVLLELLRQAQEKVENQARIDLKSAKTLLAEEAAPLGEKMATYLEKLVGNQKKLSQGIERKVADGLEAFKMIEQLVLIFGLLFGTIISVVFIRSLTRPISELVEVARAIASGNYVDAIDVKGAREMRHLADEMLKMSTSLGRLTCGLKDEQAKLMYEAWLKESLSDLLSSLQGITHVSDFSCRLLD